MDKTEALKMAFDMCHEIVDTIQAVKILKEDGTWHVPGPEEMIMNEFVPDILPDENVDDVVQAIIDRLPVAVEIKVECRQPAYHLRTVRKDSVTGKKLASVVSLKEDGDDYIVSSTIDMPPQWAFPSRDHFIHVLFHEVAHWATFEDGLGMIKAGHYDECESCSAVAEIIADITACLMTRHLGMPPQLKHTCSYVNHFGHIMLDNMEPSQRDNPLNIAGPHAGHAFRHIVNNMKPLSA